MLVQFFTKCRINVLLNGKMQEGSLTLNIFVKLLEDSGPTLNVFMLLKLNKLYATSRGGKAV